MTDPKTDKATEAKAEPKVTEVKAAEARASARTGTKVDTYKVTAPYVTLKSRSDAGAEVILGYFAGGILPDNVDLEDLARHIRKGMVEKVEGTELKTVRQQQADADKAAESTAVEDKEGAEAVKEAEATRKAVEDAEAAEDAAAKKEGRPRIKAADSPRGTKTAATG